jgi:hypothetical protein
VQSFKVRNMGLNNQIPDKTLLQTVLRKMAQKGAGSRVSATVRSGDATVTGSIAYEHERKAIIRSVAGVQGIRRVIDQLQLIVKKKILQGPPQTSSYSATPDPAKEMSEHRPVEKPAE